MSLERILDDTLGWWLFRLQSVRALQPWDCNRETEVLRKLTKLIQPLLLCEDYSSVQTGKTLVLFKRPLCPLLLLRGRQWDSELKLRPKLKSETSWSLIASCFYGSGNCDNSNAGIHCIFFLLRTLTELDTFFD